jgi:hypothetical protein
MSLIIIIIIVDFYVWNLSLTLSWNKLCLRRAGGFTEGGKNFRPASHSRYSGKSMG